MVYPGFLRIGGMEIVNTERARGYIETADCPKWLVQEQHRCESLQDALADEPYHFNNIALAPWYDLSLPDLSSRFYGVVGLGFKNLLDSSRSATLTEGTSAGGTIGRMRKGAKQPRVRATLLSRGDDAMEYGLAWLNSVFDGNCSQHGDACGVTDMEFLSDCPPERAQIPTFTEWVAQETNLAPNSSFEAAAGSVEVRRNRNPSPRLVNSISGWSTTAPIATITATANGAQVDVASGPTSVPLFFQATDLTVATGDLWSSSMEVSVPAGFPAASVQLRNYAYGMNSIVGSSPVVTIQPGTTATLVADSGTALTSAATGLRTILYANGTPTGVRIVVRNALAEKAATAGRYFDGATPPKVRRNLALNPRATTSSGWLSNNAATNPLVRGVAPSIPHPLGITTVAEQSSTGTNSALGTVYNFDSLANVGTPARALGMWVLVTEPGYRVGANNGWVGSDELPVNQWTFVKNGTAAAGAYAIVTIQKTSGNASTTARVQMTGALVEEGAGPVGDYFDGSTIAAAGFANAWDSVANSSPSYVYDVDLTSAWSGTADASPSTLTGVPITGVTAANGVAIRSTRWAKEGSYSMRLIPLSTTASVAAVIMGMPLTATQIVSSYIEAPLTGTIDAHAMSLRRINPVQQSKRPNTAGEYEHRLVSTSSSGTGVELWGARAGAGDIWYDLLTVIADAIYDGAAFTGSTVPANPELERFVWNGTPNASSSRRDIRSRSSRPETDAEYYPKVDNLRRFMHEVSVTGGPILVDQRRSYDGEFRITTVEWTISAERPWIYSLTRPVQLPVTPTTVLQDTPYNLVPRPSAELADGTVTIGTNYSLNPSLEANSTGWAATPSAVTGTDPTSRVTSGRVTGELQAVGASSFRARLLGDGVAASGRARIQIAQTVDVSTRPANSRVSATIWGALLNVGPATPLHSLVGTLQWLTAADAAVGSPVALTAGTGGLGGDVFSAKSLVVPATATKARVILTSEFDWTSGTTNSDVRAYADALAVTVP